MAAGVSASQKYFISQHNRWDMPFNWKDVLSKVAPSAAALLGGPFAGLAVQAIGDALGVAEPTTKKIQDALSASQLSGDQIVALKTAELQVQQHLQDSGIQLESILANDRDSARSMQISIRSNIPAVISILVIILSAIGEGSLLAGFEPKVSPELVGRILGTLDSATIMVLSFWLGTTHESGRKTELIAGQK